MATEQNLPLYPRVLIRDKCQVNILKSKSLGRIMMSLNPLVSSSQQAATTKPQVFAQPNHGCTTFRWKMALTKKKKRNKKKPRQFTKKTADEHVSLAWDRDSNLNTLWRIKPREVPILRWFVLPSKLCRKLYEELHLSSIPASQVNLCFHVRKSNLYLLGIFGGQYLV